MRSSICRSFRPGMSISSNALSLNPANERFSICHRRMNGRLFLHGLAKVSLLYVAATSIYGAFHRMPAVYGPMWLAPLFGLLIWFPLLFGIWERPRTWGLGVGIFLLLMVAFQSYLFSLAIHDPRTLPPGDWSTARFILKDELPIFIAAMSCMLLRFFPPKASPPPVPRSAAPRNGGA